MTETTPEQRAAVWHTGTAVAGLVMFLRDLAVIAIAIVLCLSAAGAINLH